MHPQLKILIVDGEEELAVALQRELQLEGYNADYTTSPHKALEMIKIMKYQIIMTDIVTLGTDGIELFEAIKKNDHLTQVIIMTEFSTMDITVKYLEKGAADYVLKPFTDMKQVLQAILLAEIKLSRWRETMRGELA